MVTDWEISSSTLPVFRVYKKSVSYIAYRTYWLQKKSKLYTSFYYQTLHNTSFYSYKFRPPIVAVIRESLSTDVHRVEYVSEW
jgi:hypothetical protein